MSQTRTEPAEIHEPTPREPTPSAPTPTGAPEAIVESDLLVEDISIDGMCGVY